MVDPEATAKNVISVLEAAWGATWLVGLLLGLGFILYGCTQIVRIRGNKMMMVRQPTAFSYGMSFILVGFLLVNLGQFLDAFSMTLFESEAIRELSYSSGSVSGAIATYAKLGVFAVQFIGLVSFIRGTVALRSVGVGKQGGNMSAWGGIVFVCAGVIGLNIDKFMLMTSSIIGGRLYDLAQDLFA